MSRKHKRKKDPLRGTYHTACLSAIRQEEQVVVMAKSRGMKLRVSEVEACNRIILHWMLNDGNGKRIVDYWPSNGKWRCPHTGDTGTVKEPSGIVAVGASLTHGVEREAVAPDIQPLRVMCVDCRQVAWWRPGTKAACRLCGGKLAMREKPRSLPLVPLAEPAPLLPRKVVAERHESVRLSHSRCRYCDAEIVWGRYPSGRWLPLELRPDGSKMIDGDGFIGPKDKRGPSVTDGVRAWPHWINCSGRDG